MKLAQVNLRKDDLFTDEYDSQIARHVDELGHMHLFNSSIPLSKSFIVQFVEHIEWHRLRRQLPEPLVDRYKLRILEWNYQLYGEPRTFEFVIRYASKFDWEQLSMNPPDWFNEVHFEYFGDRMNWKHITRQIAKLSWNLIMLKADYMDWEWISENYVADESFAKRFVRYINWSHPNLDIRKLSTEFLYDIYTIRKICSEFDNDLPIMYISKYKKICVSLRMTMVGEFDPNQKIIIGTSISTQFVVEHKHELDWGELIQRDLVTDEMMEALANQ